MKQNLTAFAARCREKISGIRETFRASRFLHMKKSKPTVTAKHRRGVIRIGRMRAISAMAMFILLVFGAMVGLLVKYAYEDSFAAEQSESLDSGVSLKSGSNLIYTLTTNYDGVDASSVSSETSDSADLTSRRLNVTDSLPAGLTYVSASVYSPVKQSDGSTSCASGNVVGGSSGVTYDSTTGQVYYVVENLPAGCKLDVDITVKVPSDADLTAAGASQMIFSNIASIHDFDLSSNSHPVSASGVIASDPAPLVAKVGSGGAEHNITYSYTGTVPAGAPAASSFNATAVEGQTVRKAQVPHINGWEFLGFSSTPTMQTFSCSSLSTGETISLVDERENGINSYIVGKTADGNCWMLQNLRLGSSVETGGSITVDKVNNTTGENDGTFSLSGKIASGGKFSYSTNNGYNYTNDSPQFACNDDYGCYYNWTAATAGTGLSSTTANDAPASICPAGWVLPSRANNVSLASAYSNTAANLLVPSDIRSTDTLNSGGAIPGLTLGGNYFTSGRNVAGSYGYYWSRTAYSGQYAYSMSLDSSSVSASHYNDKYGGFSVRCMSSENSTTTSSDSFTMPSSDISFTGSWTAVDDSAKNNVTYTVSGVKPSGYTAPNTVKYAEGDTVAVDTTASGTVIDGYEFSGWTVQSPANASTTGFSMPSSAVTITGSFTDRRITAPTMTVTFGSGNDTYAVNNTVPITITVRNPNSYALTNVKLSQTLSATATNALTADSSYRFTTETGVTVSGTGSSGIATIASIPANGSVTLHGTYTVPAEPETDEVVTNTVTVTDATASGYYFVDGYSNAEDSDTTTILYTMAGSVMTGINLMPGIFYVLAIISTSGIAAIVISYRSRK